MSDNRKVVVIILAVALVAGLMLMMFSTEEVVSPSETTTQTQTADSQTTEDTEPLAEVDKVIELGMQNFSFSEEELSVNAGETVTVNLTNNGGTHDFVIDELDVQSEIISSGQTSVTFTVPEDTSGESYSFYCSVGNHRAQGMEGQLTVS